MTPKVVCQICGREFSMYPNGHPKRHKQGVTNCPGMDMPGIVPETTAVEFTEPDLFRREVDGGVGSVCGTVSVCDRRAEYVLLDTTGAYRLRGQALDDLIVWLAQARERMR